MAEHLVRQVRPQPFPPDSLHQGHGKGHQRPSLYSEKLKTNVTWDNKLKRNVLEITLEKVEDTFVDLGQEAIARLFKTLGINTEREVEGYFQRNKSIHVWLINGINLDKFCKNESIKVTKNIKTGFIRPAGKKEVTVTVTGLEFNTPDTFVMEYLAKFGTVITSSVIYDRYKEGPFHGKYNGDRKYQVDFTKSSVSMGTFHIIDGSRVRIHYPGNKKTCGRCHQTSETCKGSAVAKDCESNGGVRMELVNHMRNLWSLVGFQPQNFQLNLVNDKTELTNDATIKENNKFSPKIDRPKPTEEDKNKYNGVSIKNFPKEIKKEDIIEFLKSRGLPADFSSDNIEVGTHGNVEVDVLSSVQCQELIEKIHFVETRTTFFGKPIYCRATRNLTPEKPAEEVYDNVEDSKEAAAVENDEEAKEKDPKPNNGDNEFEFEDDPTEKGIVFEPLTKIDSKLLNSGGESSAEESGDESTAKLALKFKKDTKATPAPKNKADKRSRTTPTGTSETKIGKKTKTN